MFSGLHALLSGFEEGSDRESECVEDILLNGGQISGEYDSICTHVVVYNLPLSDPVCCLARQDGKALVTDNWITDCVATNALADVNDVLYRPLKNLHGIDGCKDLSICLTGYQGTARRNIMRMVQRMGAKFSKPLIASQVTHLVCYKLEGEKYELAKRTGIALVNHFWLVDCLKSWTKLPESDYSHSGEEAEKLKSREIIAEDSGDEDGTGLQDNYLGKVSACEEVAPAAGAPSLHDNGGDPIVNDDLSKAWRSPEKSRAFDGLSPPATNVKVRQVDPVVDRIRDVVIDIGRLEEMSPVCKPSAAEFPDNVAVWQAEKGKGSPVLDDEEGESTQNYVEDGNKSDCSGGRTSHAEMEITSQFLVSEIKKMEPLDAIAATSQEMEVMDIVPEQTSRLSVDGAEDHKSTSRERENNFETPEPKRRRCSNLSGKDEAQLDTKRSPGDADAQEYADNLTDENVCIASARNEQLLNALGSPIKEDSLPCVAVPRLSLSKSPQEMEDCNPKSSCSTEEFVKEMFSNQIENDDMHVESEHESPIGRSGPIDQSNADTDFRPNKQGRQKKSDEKASAAGSTRKGKKKVLKTNAATNNARPAAIAKIAQSYNPLRKQKGSQKDEGNEDKENHNANVDHPTVEHTPLKNNTAIKKTSESRKQNAWVPSKMCFAVGGSTNERKKLHTVVKTLGGKLCQSRHQWRDGATHVILPGPLRRTEKFLAGAAAGRWILKPEYLEASRDAGKFLEEEAYEWFGEGTNDKDSISLQAPKRWRTSVATTGAGAFHRLRALFYGECISPPLGTMKRAIKAGGGLVLATAPPFTRHLAGGEVNFAIISPGMSKEDPVIQEFLKHEVACVLSEYFVDLVCHPSSSLEKHILYGTEKLAQQHRKDMAQFGLKGPTVQRQSIPQNQKARGGRKAKDDDVSCDVCRQGDHGEVMLLCGDGEGAGCNAGCHIHCCTPPLQKVPDEDWFCPKCTTI